ncbi:MAG: hypothetical protein GC157_03640 [Frankiales bacterium]|nr:hypothetical protein [Frankiales bacterium]
MARVRGSARPRRAVASVLGGLLALGLLGPAPAGATPHGPPGSPPSAASVRRAHDAAVAAAARLTRARALVAAAQRRLDALDTRVEQAVERWDAARAEADAAAGRLATAQAAARAAQDTAAGAQADVDRLAAASYQVGADLSGGLGQWAAVVDSVFRPGGISSLADRVAAVGAVTASRRHDLDSAVTLRLQAAQALAAAARSSADLAATRDRVAAAATAVQDLEASQRDEVARLTAQRDTAARLLAGAQTRESRLAAARAEALRQARARRLAAARAAAAAEAARLAREHAGSGGRPPADSGGAPRAWPQGRSVTTQAQRLGALAFAKTQLGKPYVAGEHGPDGYDCSGLTSASYAHVGVSMIQYSQAQFAAGEKIPVSRLRPGDLVFFATDPNDWGTIHHVGMYAGNGLMVEAPHTGDHVKFQTIWQSELVPVGARP